MKFYLLLSARVSVLALLLAACAPKDQGYLPFDAERWWFYTIQTKVLGETHDERQFVANERVKGDLLVQRLQAQHLRVLRKTDDGIVQIVESPAVAPYQTLLLPAPPKLGFTWQVKSQLRLIESRTFAPEDRLRGRRLPFELSGKVVGANDSVEVPAGKFTDCLHLEFHGTRNVRVDRGTQMIAVSVVQHEWYAPGIGLIKATREETSESQFLKNGYFTQELATYGD